MSNELKIPGPQNGIPDLIDMALMQRQSEETGNYFPLRPSSAGYCSRRLAHQLESYYGIAEHPREERKPETIRLLNLGNSIEWHSIKNFDMIANLAPELKVRWKQQGVSLFRLDPVVGEIAPLIEGSIDLCLVNQETGEAGIVDCKSKGDKFNVAFKSDWDAQADKFNGMKTLIKLTDQSWYAPELEPFLDELNDVYFSHNFVQVNSYCCTDWAKDHQVSYGAIYRYNKNSSKHIEIRFKPSDKMFQKLKVKFNNIYRNVVLGTIENIKPDCFLGSPLCAYGPLNNLCWGEDALQAYFKTFPKKKWATDAYQVSPELADSLEAYEQLNPALENRDKLEQMILREMVENQVVKVKAPSGKVYEAKHLKSPKPHFELRLTKV